MAAGKMKKSKTVKCAVVGASGYAGLELLRILGTHPNARIVLATSNTHSGRAVKEVFPTVDAAAGLIYQPHSEAARFKGADVFFTALPHGKSYDIMPGMLENGRVVDISADFRLENPADYDRWYEYTHPLPEVLSTAVYGLTEIYREKVRNARLVANPGCYPTSVGLALHPLAAFSDSVKGPFIIDSKSGYSGAGRSLKPHLLFSEAMGEFTPYAMTGHRHTSEMIQEAARVFGRKTPVTFTPHLIPVTRGILTMIYAPLKKKLEIGDIRRAYREFYSGEQFVRVPEDGLIPSVKQVVGTNLCMINVYLDTDLNMLKIVSAIDNLVKGAAGQAVQNLNVMFGFPECAGLSTAPLMP